MHVFDVDSRAAAGRCRTAVLSGVASCQYGLTAALESGALALLTNLQVPPAPAHISLLCICSDHVACQQAPTPWC